MQILSIYDRINLDTKKGGCMKKILILTVTAGNGHNACARGMKNKLESLGGVEVKIVDLLKEFSTKLNVWVADKGYGIAVSKLLKLYNAFFRHFQKAKAENRYKCNSQPTVVSTLDGLMKEILDFQPDVIYSTHFYGGIAVTDLKLLYALPCTTIASALDYVNSPFWEAVVGVDHFVIPNEDFVDEFMAEGFRRDQLLPIGLPVDTRSLEGKDKKEARKELGLDEGVFTIMVMFGGGYWSGGFKIFKDLIKALKGRKAQVIMINGKNKKGYDKIEKMKFEDNIKVLNVGFTNNVPLYLSAADVILNKFGGTSVTEMINKSLPMLITEKVPEQERQNLIYMKKKGVALSFKNGKQLKSELLKLMDNPQLLEDMSEKTKPLQRRTLDDLAGFMKNLPKADYSEILSQEIDYKHLKKNVKKALNQAHRKEKQNIRYGKKVGVQI